MKHLMTGRALAAVPTLLLALTCLTGQQSCEPVPLDADGDGYTSDLDCDDLNPLVFPGAEEVCNGIDDDCDGMVDDALTSLYFEDQDGDGYGSVASTLLACEPPSGYVLDATDCDDGDARVNPAAIEICNGLDDDCDGVADGSDAAGTQTWYADQDSDTYGDPASAAQSCQPLPGYVSDATDCDDGDARVNPAAVEICDEVDNDCDGLIDTDDDSVDPSTCGPACGNGVVDPGELCDDGNTIDADGCDQFCALESCGDGVVTAGEECDDANDLSDDGCADCTIDEGYICSNAINLNTGSDGHGGQLPLGTADPRWEWSESLAGPWNPTGVLRECVAAWADAPANAQWVSRSQCATPSGATTYYRILFNIPSEAAAAATTLSGTVWADDVIVGVTLNGEEAPVPEGSGFNGDGADFGAWPSSLYQAGINEMVITVQNVVLHAFTPDGLLVSVPDAFEVGSQCRPE